MIEVPRPEEAYASTEDTSDMIVLDCGATQNLVGSDTGAEPYATSGDALFGSDYLDGSNQGWAWFDGLEYESAGLFFRPNTGTQSASHADYSGDYCGPQSGGHSTEAGQYDCTCPVAKRKCAWQTEDREDRWGEGGRGRWIGSRW